MGRKAISALLMFALLGGIAWFWRSEPDVRAASLLMLGSAVLRSYFLTVRGVLQGLGRFADDSAIVVGDRALVLAFGAIALALHQRVVGLAFAFLLARVLAVCGAFLVARRHVGTPRPAFDAGAWRDLQRRAL